MFDIGFSELLLIAVVALVVLGPERLPRAARFAGLWVRRARAQWYSVKSELERDLAADELKRSFDQTREVMRDVGDSVRTSGDELRRDFDAIRDRVAADDARATDDRTDAPPSPGDAARDDPRP